ncbi:P-loop containing nucleoside triphosphate hydrolase protein [Suhomyces tanzawaensis NRRL Y-17324]|uniref:p-loop containing nucleoside triphosphate hydrolase protein n=1 Tax=Suhomyces tanzawaensis NRRL Y-17324 TaxID=984487 RepID=A0A1E4SKY2_9ASCO|nr:P-loop containing nucleoside triphosphate hydrolase protein [Suhomyces tanzawaensis NRRL Y-17324]ODV80107.1 P-loop containing nucleoside triphosphate hydrolase protein [Suhomyces tanzawaensis NRRL Y-17324]
MVQYEEFTCVTCTGTFDTAEIPKHLSSTRHKSVQSNDEVIECEECEDNNIHQLSIIRYGLSDMSLLCKTCFDKEDKSTDDSIVQYSLSNGAFFSKIGYYFRFRDIECNECQSDRNLFVGNPSKSSQIIFCKQCLEKNPKKGVSFVSEKDDKFLYELLGMKDAVPTKSQSHGRKRTVGRKGGKAGKESRKGPKKFDPEQEARKAHYLATKQNASALKSGTTVKAIGSSIIGSKASSAKGSKKSTPSGSAKATPKFQSPNPSNKSSRVNTPMSSLQNSAVNTPRSSTPELRGKHNGNSNGEAKQQTGLKTDRKVPNPKKASDAESKSKATNQHVKEPKAGKKGAKTANENGQAKDTKEAKKKKGPKQTELKEAKSDQKKEAKELKSARNKVKESSAPKENTKKKELSQKKDVSPSSNGASSEQEPKESLIPRNTPTLTYESIEAYFREMSYNLFLEEQLTNDSNILDSEDLMIEWFADQDKKNSQFKITIDTTNPNIKRLIPEKLRSLKKTPFAVGNSIFLILNDEIPWYANIATLDIVKERSSGSKRGRGGRGRGGRGGRGRGRSSASNGPELNEMIVQLYGWNDRPLPKDVNVKFLKFLPASVPVSRVFLAMTNLSNPSFIKMLLGKEPIKQIVFKNFLKFSRDTLNDSQKVAIQSVLNNAITVLQGPPGTGKTSTIFEIILQLLDSLNTYPILVVAASNIAIDNIAEKLLPTHKNHILRIVANEKEREYNKEHPLASICLHHKSYNALPLKFQQLVDDMRRGNPISATAHKNYLKEQFEVTKQLVAQARVIFTTTVVSGGYQFKSVAKCPIVIMDEATQSSEPTTLIPLSMKGIEKFVFVGDQRQLSCFSLIPNLSLSLFERVLLNSTYKNPHMLDIQYRMHPDISEFPRNRFYGGLLKDGISKDQRKLDSWTEDLVQFLDTKGQCTESSVRNRLREDGGYTFTNRGEIKHILQVLKTMIYDKNIARTDIGVITPYSGQRDLISKCLQQDEFVNPQGLNVEIEVDIDDIRNDSKPVTIHLVSGIMIASIDAFQGREKKFLVMSCVRSNSKNTIGFLKDERRLNVALTRAQYGLIMIGDANCLYNSDPLWREYIGYLRDKNWVKEITG